VSLHHVDQEQYLREKDNRSADHQRRGPPSLTA
jgi:hypothetical protein